MNHSLAGLSFLGFARGQKGGVTFTGINPATTASLEPVFHTASLAEVDQAAKRAGHASPILAAQSGKTKALFLRDIASRIEASAPVLAARAQLETALPEARCLGEIGRTLGQLRLFADLVEKGDWVGSQLFR